MRKPSLRKEEPPSVSVPALSFPKHDLVLTERENGIYVEQHGKGYLARMWQLTDQVVGIVEIAIANDLAFLWQEGHPGGETSHHISFSFSHDRASWVFCIGDGAGAPDVKKITLSKKIRGIIQNSEIKSFWENAGGKNFSIVPGELPAFLDLVRRCRLKEIKLQPYSFHRGSVARVVGLQSERDLEDCIVEAVMERLAKIEAQIHRQRRFRSSHFAEGYDIPDFILETPTQTIVSELKLYRAIEPDVIQLSRYLANAEIKRAFGDRAVSGVLIASGFDMALRNAAAAMKNCSLYSYTEGTGLPLQLFFGPDVLGPFFHSSKYT